MYKEYIILLVLVATQKHHFTICVARKMQRPNFVPYFIIYFIPNSIITTKMKWHNFIINQIFRNVIRDTVLLLLENANKMQAFYLGIRFKSFRIKCLRLVDNFVVYIFIFSYIYEELVTAIYHSHRTAIWDFLVVFGLCVLPTFTLCDSLYGLNIAP